MIDLVAYDGFFVGLGYSSFGFLIGKLVAFDKNRVWMLVLKMLDCN